MFFSLGYYNGVTNAAKPLPDSLSTNVSLNPVGNRPRNNLNSSNRGSSHSSEPEKETPETMAEKFLNMLSLERVETENYWMDVGRALHSTFQGGPRGLDLWIQFTQRSDDHGPEDCQHYYGAFYGNNFTVKTLAWYASKDSPEAYELWHKSWYCPAMDIATSGLHTDVAEALYRVYWLEFACSALDKNALYYYNGIIWLKQTNSYTLRSRISSHFLGLFESYRADIAANVADSVDTRFKDSAEILIKKIGALINKLKTRTFKLNILGESLEKFYIDKFEQLLDSSEYLMGMANGILEANDMEAFVRPGKPEDYVSKSTGVIWQPNLSWKHPLVETLMAWLSRVFPVKDLLEYFGKLAGSCLKGRNSEKIFPILTGKGDNSKSMIKKIFEAALGAYCITFPTALFTTKRNATGPMPEIARAKATRAAFLQEPDSDDSLKNGTLKEMTGGDKFFARFLQDNGGEVDAMFKLFLMCNHVPIIPNCDKATKNRVRILPFLSTWVKNAAESEEEQFKLRQFQMDPFFERQIPKLAPAFMWYLVQMYALYRKEGLAEPATIKESTNDYWNDNDTYIQFVTENVEYAYKAVPGLKPEEKGPIDDDALIPLAQMYTRFKDWYRENFQGLKCPDRAVAKAELEARLGKIQTHPKNSKLKGWFGVKFKVDTVANI